MQGGLLHNCKSLSQLLPATAIVLLHPFPTQVVQPPTALTPTADASFFVLCSSAGFKCTFVVNLASMELSREWGGLGDVAQGMCSAAATDGCALVVSSSTCCHDNASMLQTACVQAAVQVYQYHTVCTLCPQRIILMETMGGSRRGWKCTSGQLQLVLAAMKGGGRGGGHCQ